MIAVDTNLLVYAHRREHEWHAGARACLDELAESGARWAIPWPCLHEFYAIVTRQGIFDPPSTSQQAMGQIEAWLESPTLECLGESGLHLATLKRLIVAGKLRGGAVHDARIAAICIDHGVTEIWTADRDFLKFSGVVARNPLSRAR